jgi:two-component system response regulator FixJ
MTASTTTERCVYIVDDDAAVRRALSRLIGSMSLSVSTFANPVAFLDVAPALPRGGCLLLDVRMPGMDGLELQAQLVQRGFDLPIIVMTGQGHVPTAVRAMKAGAFDFLEKPFDDEQLFGSINAALELQGPQDHDQQAIAAAKRLAALSPRERQVLDGLVAGQPNKVIATNLGLSVRTVEGYRIHMLERLGTQRLAEAIRLAVMASLAAPPGRHDR